MLVVPSAMEVVLVWHMSVHNDNRQLHYTVYARMMGQATPCVQGQ
jgi:hypothetical protein